MAKFISDEDMEKMEAAAPSPKKGFISDEEMNALESPPSRSPITAATTGLMEGAVPFAGALAGAGKAGMDAITGVRGPLAGGSIDDVVDDYRHARDEFTGDAKKAREANPGIALAGNVVGGFANPLFKGANTLPKAMGAGAIQGLGMSEADLTQGDIKGAAIDTGIGAAGGALGYGIGKAIPKVIGGAKALGKKALTILGPSEEAINARLAGKAQPNAKIYAELADEMGGTLDDLSSQITAADTEAWNTLSRQAEIPKSYVTTPIDDAISGSKIQGQTVGAADEQAERVLLSLKDKLNKLGDNISQSDLKGIIQKLDDNINWDDKSAKSLNNVLKGIRHQFDESLKFQNSEYKKAMEPVSERLQVLDALKKKFGFKGGYGEGYQPDDRTASAMKGSLSENRAVTQDLLSGNEEKGIKGLKQFTDKDYLNLADDYRLSQQFEKTAPNGSRRTVLGGLFGSAVGGMLAPGLGHSLGGVIGGGAGALADRYGGKVAAKLIDSYLKAGNSAAFGKFAPVIEKAAAKGPEALAMLASILGSNPEFQKEMGIPDEEPPARRVLSGQ